MQILEETTKNIFVRKKVTDGYFAFDFYILKPSTDQLHAEVDFVYILPKFLVASKPKKIIGRLENR